MKGGERMEIMYSVEYRKVGNYDYDYIDYFGRGSKMRAMAKARKFGDLGYDVNVIKYIDGDREAEWYYNNKTKQFE